MKAVIDVGGGMRGIFGAGVFDYCLEHGISFDHGYGVSAGCANIASYLAGQQFRNYEFYTDYAFRKAYMSWENFLRNGSYIDLDYVYGELTNEGGEYPLDYDALARNPMGFTIVTTEASTGEAVYFSKDDLARNDYAPIKASSNVPIVNRAYRIDGVDYFDGGLVDPIPYARALADGCDELVIILTRPRDQYRESDRDKRLAALLGRQHPAAAALLAGRAERYNEQLDGIKALEAQGRAMIIAPDDIGKLKTLKRDKEALKALYRKGLAAARRQLQA